MADPDDEEWLLARERGEDVSHIPAGTRARYDQLDKLIEALPEHAPPAGWKQRVLEALDAPAPRSSSDALAAPAPRSSSDALDAPPAQAPSGARRGPTSHRRRAGVLGGVAAAIGIVVVLVVRSWGTHSPLTEPIVTTETRRGESPHRSGDVAVGDTFVVHVEADQPIELRVYGDGGEPLARCTETQGCKVERSGAHRRYSLELLLRSPGDTRAVLFSGAAATPEPRKDLDADLEAARAANLEARQVAIVHVE